MTDEQTVDNTAVSRKNFIDTLRTRRDSWEFAIKLAHTYEFKRGRRAGSIIINEDKPVVSHSWTKFQKFIGPDDIQRVYPLTQANGCNLTLPVGVTAVLGRAGAGKTRLVLDLLFRTNTQRAPGSIKYISMHEPAIDNVLEEIDADNVVIPTFEADLAVTLAESLISEAVDVIIIDSLRYLFYSASGGAAGKGGVNMSLFMDMTHLDRLATAFGKRIIVVINPMTNDENSFAFYTEAASGAVAAVVVMEDPLNARVTNRYAQNRDWVNIKLPRFEHRTQQSVRAQLGTTPIINRPNVGSEIFGVK